MYNNKYISPQWALFHFRILCGIVLSLLLLVGCTGKTPSSDSPLANSRSSVPDTVYTEAKAMSIHLQDPERALLMIDSAVIVGNISWERGQYLKAITQYGGFHNYPLSRQICLDLIDKLKIGDLRFDSLDAEQITDNRYVIHKGSTIDIETLEHVYGLLVAISYSSSNFPAIIRYATEASRLAHVMDKPVELARMESDIAFALSQTGKTDEGIDRLRSVLADLRQMDTFNSVKAYHSASMNLLHILLNHKRHPEMVPVCEDLLQRIDEFASHPEDFGDMRDSFDPAEFIDFARGQALAFLTTAYARHYTAAEDSVKEVTPAIRAQLLKKALAAETEMFKTKWSQTPDCDVMMSASYHHLGQFDRFDAAIARMDSAMTDSISLNHCICLSLRSTAAQMRGRLAEAIGYMNRLFVIRDSIDARNQRDQLAELATVYHLQEEQFARQQAENDACVSHLYLLFISFALLAAIAFAVYFFYKRRETDKKNHVLAREIAEAIKYKEKYDEAVGAGLSDDSLIRQQEEGKMQSPAVADSQISNPDIHDKPNSATQESAPTSDSELFAYLRQAIIVDLLYLDPQLDRQALVDRFGLSKERIGAAFAKGSPYKSLIEFLTDCRLPYAAKMLIEHPELTIADVAQKSGFPSLNTFGRNFKQKYALTPSQFREQQ